MNRSEVRLLQEFREYPSVSILLPTHRSLLQTGEDRSRLEELTRQVQEQIQRQLSARDAQPVLDNIASLVETIDFRSNRGDSLALLANRHFGKKYALPFPVKERVVIAEIFALRELVEALYRTVRYRVLILSDCGARLLIGTNNTLKEANVQEFPMEYHNVEQVNQRFSSREKDGTRERRFSVVIGATPLPRDESADICALKDEIIRRFFLQVDRTITKMIEQDSSPLILVATEGNIALYKQVTHNEHRIESVLIGTYPNSYYEDLRIQCTKLVEQFELRQTAAELQEFEASIKGNRYATGIQEVWKSARQGRCKKVLVERNYFCPSTMQGHSGQIQLIDHPEYFSQHLISDAVDALIGEVLSENGDVCFVDDGALQKFDHVAAVLRY